MHAILEGIMHGWKMRNYIIYAPFALSDVHCGLFQLLYSFLPYICMHIDRDPLSKSLKAAGPSNEQGAIATAVRQALDEDAVVLT